MVPPFPPPTVPGSVNTAQLDDENFPEPNSRTDPIQIHTTSSQIFTMTEGNIPTKHDDRATLPTEIPTFRTRRYDDCIFLFFLEVH